MAKPWRPTGGRDSLLEARLNTGTWNGKPIYLHYTSAEGLNGISNLGQINATPKQDRRGGNAKRGVYLNPVLQTFCPQEALTLLFFDNETYRYSSTQCIVFAFLNQPGEGAFKRGALTEGSWVDEIIYYDDVAFSRIDILYRGPNNFVPLRHQSYPRENIAEMFRTTKPI